MDVNRDFNFHETLMLAQKSLSNQTECRADNLSHGAFDELALNVCVRACVRACVCVCVCVCARARVCILIIGGSPFTGVHVHVKLAKCYNNKSGYTY